MAFLVIPIWFMRWMILASPASTRPDNGNISVLTLYPLCHGDWDIRAFCQFRSGRRPASTNSSATRFVQACRQDFPASTSASPDSLYPATRSSREVVVLTVNGMLGSPTLTEQGTSMLAPC